MKIEAIYIYINNCSVKFDKIGQYFTDSGKNDNSKDDVDGSSL